jgi:probable F420-dependent oxidoreductase
MKLDTGFGVGKLGQFDEIVAHVKRAEEVGFDGLWSNETRHDPFLPLVVAAQHTQHIQLGTSIAVAFARSPMSLAQTAWDLQRLSNGRFLLGLGTQVKAHIERRFGMTWDKPVERLREYILAMRDIWRCWQTGERLNFRGDFFKLTLMTPFFSPEPITHPHIPIYIAGVNEHLCRLAGETCEGFHLHPFHTRRYLAEFVLPNIEAGAKSAGRDLRDVEIATSVFVIGGDTPPERNALRAEVRRQISFYASTPSYHTVFALHGWQDAADALSQLASRGKWDEMPSLVTDQMLDAFAIEGAWEELPQLLVRRYDGLLGRVAYYFDAPERAHRAAVSMMK